MTTITQATIATLIEEITKRGLPLTVGATGQIEESESFEYEGQSVGKTREGLKGWMEIYRDCNEFNDGEPSFEDTESLIAIIKAMVNNRADDTELEVTDADGEVRYITLNNDSADGKSLETEVKMDYAEFSELVKSVLEENGEEFDEDEIDEYSFMVEHCDSVDNERFYSLAYNVAWLKFEDGTQIGIIKNGDELDFIKE